MSSNPTDNIVKIINQIYIHQAGPFGQIVCEESLENWQNSGTPYSTQKMGYYIDLLLEELADNEQRKEFISQLARDPAIAHIISIKQFIQKNS